MALEYDLVAHADDALALRLEGRPADPGTCILLQQVEGLDGPPITEETEPLPSADGDYLGPVRARGAVMILEGLLVAPDRVTLRALERQLRATFAEGTDTWPLRLEGRVGDPETLERLVRVSQPLRCTDQGGAPPGAGKPWQVALRCASPRWAGVTERVATVPRPEGVGGFTYPYSYPYSYGGSSSPGTTVTTTGDARAWPVLTITGPITTPVLENLTNGRALYLTTTLGPGESLVIDTAARTVTRNGPGGANAYNAVDRAASSWWPLEPGANAIRVRAADSADPAELTVAWRDAYR